MQILDEDSIDASPPYKPKKRSLVFQWAFFLLGIGIAANTGAAAEA
nr:hypothetical protein [Comamonas koreensis]